VQIQKFILGPMASNCYIVWPDGEKEGVIIDPGYDSKEITDFIAEKGLCIDKILLTHGHFDHIGGLEMVRKATKAPVYIYKDDAECLTSAGTNISTMVGQPMTFEPAEVLMKEGDEIAVGSSEKLKVIHTPGHTPGGCCFAGDKVVFTGDTLFQQSVGRSDFPGGDYYALMDSVKKLMALDDALIVLPGHGDNSTIGFERTHNPFV